MDCSTCCSGVSTKEASGASGAGDHESRGTLSIYSIAQGNDQVNRGAQLFNIHSNYQHDQLIENKQVC